MKINMNETQTYIFFCLIVLFAFICIWFATIKQKRRKILCLRGKIYIINVSPQGSLWRILSLAFLASPLVLRNCGTDTSWYFYSYSVNRQIGDEPIFYLLQRLLYKVFPDARIGFGILSVLSLVIVFFAFNILKDEVDIKYCYLAYFFTQYFCLYNYMRMMLAVSFLILGYAYILKENKSKALIVFFIAVGIHFASLAVLVTYIVVCIFQKNRKLIVLAILGCTGLFLSNPKMFFSMIKYDRYEQLINSVESYTIGLGTFIRVLPIIIIQHCYLKRFKGVIQYNILFISTYLNLAFSFLGYFSGSASRISNNMMIMHLLFFVPWIIKKIKNKNEKLYLELFYLVYLFGLFFLSSITWRNIGIVPYR